VNALQSPKRTQIVLKKVISKCTRHSCRFVIKGGITFKTGAAVIGPLSLEFGLFPSTLPKFCDIIGFFA
jgi:hypothetical protein